MSLLSVVVPAYNEADRLPASIVEMRRYLDSLGEEYEVLVVDDGSRDNTVEVVREAGRCWPQLQVIAQGVNLGKGGAVRTGMLAARGELRLFSDADLSTPMEELAKLRERIGGRCQIAIASRALPGSIIEEHQPGRREMIGRSYNRLLRVLALPGLRDTQCGFKLFTAEAAVACFEPLKTLRFGFDAEVLLRGRRHGWVIAEVPVRWRHREDSRVSPLRDSARTLYELVTLRFNARR
ncbi:MAG TPA: dolichyl-phosphate beta-glucosyltransferase [Candidatus Acidoferrales bacterium]|nr:dolichyl-phosphate beta-glucosyltransferase [Candidatus Acidoferrales bacterium]